MSVVDRCWVPTATTRFTLSIWATLAGMVRANLDQLEELTCTPAAWSVGRSAPANRRTGHERPGDGHRELFTDAGRDGDLLRPRRAQIHLMGLHPPSSGIRLVPSMGPSEIAMTAMIESFWGRVQAELLNRGRCKTRVELAQRAVRVP